MKRIFFLLLILGCICMAPAQTKKNENLKKLKLGLMVSPQLSWFTSDNNRIDARGTNIGLSYGILGDLFFAKNYAISLGILRCHTGGKLTFKNDLNPHINVGKRYTLFENGESIRYKLNYIELPVGLKLKTQLFRRIAYYGQLGLTPMINTKATNENGAKLDKEVQIFDLGYHFGGGIEYSLGGETYLHAALFYNNGMIDITTNDDLNDITHLNSIKLRIGINF